MIIGIVGAIGSGKDTIADYLVSKYSFQRLTFASKVKDVAHAVFGWDRSMLEGLTPESRAWREEVDPFWNISPRQALQKIGTEMFRTHISDDVWVKAVLKEIMEKPGNIVVPDCRFANEANMILEQGGFLIYVERGERPSWADDAIRGKKYDSTSGIHVTDWNSFAMKRQIKLQVMNDGTLEDLYRSVDTIMDMHK